VIQLILRRRCSAVIFRASAGLYAVYKSGDARAVLGNEPAVEQRQEATLFCWPQVDERWRTL
jgi:hypothetical protein